METIKSYNYKKILEGVVNIINTAEKSDIGFANICAYIGENCPELKESEGEKIRGKLMSYFRRKKRMCITKNFPWNTYRANYCLARKAG